jgi:hypothetical protein
VLGIRITVSIDSAGKLQKIKKPTNPDALSALPGWNGVLGSMKAGSMATT